MGPHGLAWARMGPHGLAWARAWARPLALLIGGGIVQLFHSWGALGLKIRYLLAGENPLLPYHTIRLNTAALSVCRFPPGVSKTSAASRFPCTRLRGMSTRLYSRYIKPRERWRAANTFTTFICAKCSSHQFRQRSIKKVLQRLPREVKEHLRLR